MPGFFFNLGRLVGPKVRKGRWVWNSFTADENQIIEAEYQVGHDMAAAMAGQTLLDDDAASGEYVRELGGRLASRLTDRRRRWTFYLVRSESANAWALPGGFIFITSKLLDLCERDANEIAFILGHEMGHVVHKHAFDRLVSSTLLTAASVATPLGRLVTPNVVHVGARLMQAAYSQDQELDADKYGVRLTTSAGLDPAAAIRSMQRLQATHAGQPDLLAWFATHPPFPTRIARIQGFIK